MAAYPTIKLTYFNIEAAAEKVRLTLSVAGVPFEDKRVQFSEFGAMKASLPNGQLPVMEVDGEMFTQSEAMCRWAASLGDGSLYPRNDAKQCYAIDRMLGLLGDDTRSFMPALYMGMMPHKFGYPEDFAKTDEGKAMVKMLREKFVKEELPVYMGHLSKAVEGSGGPFLCGDSVSLADLCWLPRLRYLRSGIADHVPADCCDVFLSVVAWIDAVMEVPGVKAWYAVNRKI